MKRNMQIESVTRSTFCATNITNTIRMAFVKLVAACGFVKCTSFLDGKISFHSLNSLLKISI